MSGDLTLFDLDLPSPTGATAAKYESDRLADAAFDHYRQVGFPSLAVPLHDAFHQLNVLAAADTDGLAGSVVGYHIPDGYQPHRFTTRVGTAPTVVEQFYRDDRLRHALRRLTDLGMRVTDESLVSRLAIVRAAQLPAQFRPGYALSLIRRYCPAGGTVFDPSTGYGGRLVGFLASSASAYVGIDPEPRTSAGNRRMAADFLDATQEVRLIEAAAEDVDPAEVVGTADFALSSPPYFDKERYGEDEGQSWVRYGDPESWRVGFLEPYVRLIAAALRPGAYAAINVADVRSKSREIPLVAWTREAGVAAGLSLVETQRLGVGRAPSRGDVIAARRGRMRRGGV